MEIRSHQARSIPQWKLLIHLTEDQSVMIKQIPNGLTLLNLFCGSVAIPLVLMSFTKAALILCGICLLADLLDGMVARWLKADSPLGVQLDSLADMISFGLLPGIIIFYVLQRYGTGDISVGFTILAFLIPVSAALRLAKFNIDTRERTYFYGLPTPAGALFAFGVLWLVVFPSTGITAAFLNPLFLYGLIVILVVGYHIPLKLPGMKGSRAARIWLLVIAVVGITTFFIRRELAVLVMPLSYLLIGIIHRFIPLY